MKNLKLIGVFFFGLCFFVGAHAQEAAAPKEGKSMVQKSSLTIDDLSKEFEHFPSVEMLPGEDAKTASARHRKLLQEWQTKYPKEYAAFEKKMRSNVKLTEEGQKAASQKKSDAETNMKDSQK